MNSESVNKAGLSFSLSDLPSDYPYRYSLNYILMELMNERQRLAAIERLIRRLKFTKRMLQNYRYVRLEETKLQLSEERLEIIATTLNVAKDLLIYTKKAS